MNPDLDGPKTCGSGSGSGFGSPILLRRNKSFSLMVDPGATGGHAGHPAVSHPVRAAQAHRVQPAGRHHTAGGRPQPRQTE